MNSTGRLIFIILASLVALFCVDILAKYLMVFVTTEQGFFTKLNDQIGGINPRETKIVGFAFAVGVLGAFAFYFGVFVGFIGRESRDKTLQYFGFGWSNLGRIFLFCVTGGIVAAVFQSAQLQAFTPIQAFVLGATWPSVVTQIMSGDGSKMTSGARMTDASPASIPAPAGQSAKDAEVNI